MEKYFFYSGEKGPQTVSNPGTSAIIFFRINNEKRFAFLAKKENE